MILITKAYSTKGGDLTSSKKGHEAAKETRIKRRKETRLDLCNQSNQNTGVTCDRIT
jgi:hypothetical protein